MIALLAGMEIGELQPGLYKIIKHDEVARSAQVHLLRVTGYGAQCKYFLDDSEVGAHPHAFENSEWYEYRVMKKYPGVPQVFRPSLWIRFTDEDGHEFAFSMRDVWTLKNVFQRLHWLKDAFGFKPNTSTEKKFEAGTSANIGHHIRRKRGS